LYPFAVHRLAQNLSREFIKYQIGLGKIMVLGNLGGGMMAAFSILAILAVANTMTTYITPTKSTLQEVIDSRTGLNSAAVV